MFQKIFVLLFCNVAYNVVVCDSVCSEYILIFKETKCSNLTSISAASLNEINWDKSSCPKDSRKTFTYDEFQANKSCVIELTNKFESECQQKETVTSDPINIIYVNESSTNNSLERQHINFVMQCSFSNEICIDDDTDTNDTIDMNDHSAPGNTIVVSIKKNDNINTKMKYKNDIKNTDNFKCSEPFSGTEVIQDEYLTLTYNVIRKYKCSHHKSKTLSTDEADVYFHTNFIHNNTKLENIGCTNPFKSMNDNTLSINCNTAASNINDGDDKHSKNDLNVVNIFGIDLNKSLTWHCEFGNNFDILSKKPIDTKIINFKNCSKGYKNIKNDSHLDYNDVLMVLKNNDSVFKKSHNDIYTNLEDFSPKIEKENLNLHLTFNNDTIEYSNCKKALQNNITNGNIINTWTTEEENAIRKDYNTTLIELNIINCGANNSKAIENDRDVNKSLEMNIVFSKPNNTNITTSIINDLYNVKTNASKIVIIDCMQPNLKKDKINSNSSDANKLVLNCMYTDLDTVKKPKPETKFERIQETTDIGEPNVTDTTEHNISGYTSGMMRNSTETGDGTSLDPIVYIFIALATICVVSAAVILALKKWKAPVSYHLTSTRDWPAEGCE